MTYQIGQVVDHKPGRGITAGPETPPRWYALMVPPGKEAAARSMLKRHGVHAQYPIRERRHRQRGKMIVRKLPVVTQIVYARFTEAPQWDVLKARRLITGVIAVHGVPVVLSESVVRAIMGMPTVEEELRRARAEMMRLREGDRAEILEGPLTGFTVEITKVSAARVWFETVAGIKGEADAGIMERVVQAC